MKHRTYCEPDWQDHPGFRSTTPARGTRRPTCDGQQKAMHDGQGTTAPSNHHWLGNLRSTAFTAAPACAASLHLDRRTDRDHKMQSVVRYTPFVSQRHRGAAVRAGNLQ